MNHLVILAHPNPKSFCKGIVETIEVISHTFFGVAPYVTDETRTEYLKEVEKIIKDKI